MVLTDMYMHHRKHGYLESAQDTGYTESLVMFIDRMFRDLEPWYTSEVITARTPQKTPEGRPVQPVPSTGKRKAQVLQDGDHEMRETTYAIKKSKDGKKYQDVVKKTCMVCKQEGRRRSNDRYPQTTNYCIHCEGFVHSRGSHGYASCWDHHLHNCVPGLLNSGDMGEQQVRRRQRGAGSEVMITTPHPHCG